MCQLARSALSWLLLFSCIPVTGLGAGKVARDWQQYPAVVTVDEASQIWAIGDIHGDYERLVTVLRTAGLIDGKPDAAFGWSVETPCW
jgi:hypothetical protein